MSSAEFERLHRSGRVIERDARGAKVIVLPDGLYLKYFRRRRLLSRSSVLPAQSRFARNARRLTRLGVPAPRIVTLYRVPELTLGVAAYRPLPGRSLRELLAAGTIGVDEMHRLGRFVARLHHQGVLFRSLHPGNIIFDGPATGLIDVVDLHLRPWPLTRWERRRNWRHFLRCPEDQPYLTSERIRALLSGYQDAAGLSATAARVAAARLLERLER